MSSATKVEERVVSMQFDNQHFEKNVQTSLSTIEKLKQSLKFTGAAKGLENVESAAKSVNMSPLSGAVESVGLKFSAMQIVATTALANITNSAVNAGKRIVSALTIDPVKMYIYLFLAPIALFPLVNHTKDFSTLLDFLNN